MKRMIDWLNKEITDYEANEQIVANRQNERQLSNQPQNPDDALRRNSLSMLISQLYTILAKAKEFSKEPKTDSITEAQQG